jgi:hypothetical protein
MDRTLDDELSNEFGCLDEKRLQVLWIHLRDGESILTQEQVGAPLALAELTHDPRTPRREENLLDAGLGQDLRDGGPGAEK